MELKDYQQGVLERLSIYLQTLKEKKQDALDLAEARKKRGSSVDWTLISSEFNFCGRAWDELNEKRLLPFISTKHGNNIAPYKRKGVKGHFENVQRFREISLFFPGSG